MDLLHAKMLGEIVASLKPRHIVEVGCFLGVSTAHVLDACRTYSPESISLIDVKITPEVLLLSDAARAAGLNVLPMVGMGKDLLPQSLSEPDTLVILDGDHSLASMQTEIDITTASKADFVVLHDSTNFSPDCLGAVWAMHYLQFCGFECCLDCLPRPNMRTHRGLAFLSRGDIERHRRVRDKVFLA